MHVETLKMKIREKNKLEEEIIEAIKCLKQQIEDFFLNELRNELEGNIGINTTKNGVLIIINEEFDYTIVESIKKEFKPTKIIIKGNGYGTTMYSNEKTHGYSHIKLIYA